MLKKVSKTILALLIISLLPYYGGSIYNFQEGSAFQGDIFYNPYKYLNPLWIKANFHAHSKAWLGLTSGENTAEDMMKSYDSLSYTLPCISNYNSIYTPANRSPYINTYEHGINISTTHQLVINAKTPMLFDFPFTQFLSHKQEIINKLKTTDNYTVIAHPNFLASYQVDDFRYLNNYDLIELVSRNATSTRHWDEALSHGHAVWALGNDDAHQLRLPEIGVCWTTINTASTDTTDILNSLRTGAFYAIRGWRGKEMHQIRSVEVKNNAYHLELKNPADSIILKSDHGTTVASATQASSISYEIKPENSYIRAEIFETEPWNDYTRMYVNPVIRTKDGQLTRHNNENVVNMPLSVVYWLCIALLQLGLIYIIIKW